MHFVIPAFSQMLVVLSLFYSNSMFNDYVNMIFKKSSKSILLVLYSGMCSLIKSHFKVFCKHQRF